MKNYILLFVLINISYVVSANNLNVNETAILVEDTIANDPLKLKQAFAQILANNTGEYITDILRNSEFVTANIKSGIKHSYFETVEAKYLSEDSPRKYWFNLVMQQEYIQKIIKRAEFSVLPHNREKIMVWVVKDEIFEENNLSDTVEYQLNYANDNELTMYWLNHWADALKVDLVFPNVDEEDKLSVTTKSIKTLSIDAIEQSKNRYNFDHSLLLYITHSDENIKLRSGLHIPGNDMWINHYQQSNATEPELIYSLMNDIGFNYANNYKVNADDIENHTIQMVIESLDSYDEVAAIDQYLSNLSIIESYDIASASKNVLVLRVNLLITSSAFLKIVARDNKLFYNQDGAINQLRFTSIK
jgi:hypothetical protein